MPVSSDIRIIVHKTSDSLLFCYVDHLDKAYQSTERRKLKVHQKTGTARLVEVRETMQEITREGGAMGCRLFVNLSIGRT